MLPHPCNNATQNPAIAYADGAQDKAHYQVKSHYAFTLIELSIVLVIIGIIAGGVIVGRHLIKSSELQKVLTDKQEYNIAINAFKEKYSAMPGDMANATDYWGAQNAIPATCVITASNSELTCNGNGDNQIDYQAWTPNNWEGFRAWQHLVNGGFIKGKFDGIVHGSFGGIPGVNVPGSKFAPNALWGLWYLKGRSIDPWEPIKSGHYLAIGGNVGTYPNWWINELFTPQEALSIDQKIDDGSPLRGNVNDIADIYTPNCSTDQTVASTYNIALKTAQCLLIFKVE